MAGRELRGGEAKKAAVFVKSDQLLRRQKGFCFCGANANRGLRGGEAKSVSVCLQLPTVAMTKKGYASVEQL